MYSYGQRNWRNPEMLLAIIFRILMCSLGAHKEGRFILPTMGPFIIFICMGLVFYRRKSD